MAFELIASESFDRRRENGSIVTILLELWEDGGIAGGETLGVVGEIAWEQGRDTDDLHTPIVPAQAEVELRKPSSTLIRRMRAIDYHAFKMRITIDGTVLIDGPVMEDLSDYELFGLSDSVRIVVTDGLSDLANEPGESDSGFATTIANGLQQLKAKTLSSFPVDVLTRWRHDGRPDTEFFGDFVRTDFPRLLTLLGGNEDYLSHLKAVCEHFGWRLAQVNGRWVVHEPFEIANSPGSIQAYIDDGTGTYSLQPISSSSITLNRDNTIKLPGGRQSPTAGRMIHEWILAQSGLIRNLWNVWNNGFAQTDLGWEHQNVVFSGSPGNTAVLQAKNNSFLRQNGLTEGSAEFFNAWGLAIEGDQYQIASAPNETRGRLLIDDFATIDAQITILKIRAVSLTGGPTLFHDFDAGEWTEQDTGLTVRFQADGSSSGDIDWLAADETQTLVTKPVPKGFFGYFEVEGRFDIESGDSAAINNMVFEAIVGRSIEGNSPTMFRKFRSERSPASPSVVHQHVFGDRNPWGQNQFTFLPSGGGAVPTTAWIDPQGNGDFGTVAARRKGRVMNGTRQRYSLEIRDLQPVSMITPVNFIDEDQVTHLCLPVRIRREIVAGYTEVLIKEVDLRDPSTEDQFWDAASEDGGQITGSVSGGGSGGSSALDENKFLRRELNLGDLLDLPAARANMGLGADNPVVFASLDTGQGANQLYAMNQNVRSTDAVTFATLNTGHGANELYPMNQAVRTTDAVTFATLNTGQGANELYPMNQAVRTTDNVRFNDLELTGTVDFVNETNLQVEDRTITVNKNGTAGSAEGAGLIIERPGGNRSMLWDSVNGFVFGDDVQMAGLTATTIIGASIDVSGNSDANQFRINGTTVIDSNRNAEFISVQHPSFQPGFTGQNWQINTEGDIVGNSIMVRGPALFQELIFDQLSAVGGRRLNSSARGKIESVNTGNSTVTLESPTGLDATQFSGGDNFWIQVNDIDGSQTVHPSIISAKGIVSSVSGRTLTLQTDVSGNFTGTGASGNINDLSQGMVIVQRGGSGAGRQSLIYESVQEAGLTTVPFTRYMDGVATLNDFTDQSKIVTQIGNLSGLTNTPDFGALDGFGFYAKRGFIASDVTIGGRGVAIDSSNIGLWHFDDSFLSNKGQVPALQDAIPFSDSEFGRGVAVEKAVTNIQGDALVNNWGTSQVTVTTETGMLLDGVQAKRLTKTSTESWRFIINDINDDIPAGGNATFSMRCRRGTAKEIRFFLRDSVTFDSDRVIVMLNMETGGTSISTIGTLWSHVRHQAIIKGEYYEFTVTIKNEDTSARRIETNIRFNEEGTGLYMFVAGVQAELGDVATRFTETSRAKGRLIYEKMWRGRGTVVFWDDMVKDNTVNNQPILHNSTNSNGMSLFRLSDDKVLLRGDDGTSSSAPAIWQPEGERKRWFFAITYNESTAQLYRGDMEGNFEKLLDFSHGASLSTLPQNLRLGMDNDSNRQTSQIYDELAVMDRVLSEAEIKRIWASQMPLQESPAETYISGNKVRTGILESQNLITASGRATTGSLFDLNAGKLSMGFGGNNIFHFDSENSLAELSGWKTTPQAICQNIDGLGNRFVTISSERTDTSNPIGFSYHRRAGSMGGTEIRSIRAGQISNVGKSGSLSADWSDGAFGFQITRGAGGGFKEIFRVDDNVFNVDITGGFFKADDFDLSTPDYQINSGGINIEASLDDPARSLRFGNTKIRYDLAGIQAATGTAFSIGTNDFNMLQLFANGLVKARFGPTVNELLQNTRMIGEMFFETGEIKSFNMPTSDPVDPGVWYVDNGVVKVSSGVPAAPSTPTGFNVCKVDEGGFGWFQISWNSVPDVDEYEVQRRINGGSWSLWATQAFTSITDDDPFNNQSTSYQYRVRACNAGGCSSYTSILGGTWGQVAGC